MTVNGSSSRRQGVLARHKALFVLLTLVGLMFAAVGVTAIYVNQRISAIPRMELDLGSEAGRDSALGDYQRPSPASGSAAGSVNILIAGVDAGESSRIAEDLEKGPWVPGSHRSDTIMVLHITADRSAAHLISVPRDTWVPIDGYGMNKINAALSYGGPALFVRTMEQFTRLRMDHFVIVDWDGLMKLTDAFGGVELETADNVGAATMNGEETLEYVRERYSLPRGDLDRIQRQQNVVRALFGQLSSSRTLFNPIKLTEVVQVLTDSIAVDNELTNQKMRELVMSVRELRVGDITQVTVPVRAFGRIDGQSVVLVDQRGARGLFRAAATDHFDDFLATNDVDTLPAPEEVD